MFEENLLCSNPTSAMDYLAPLLFFYNDVFGIKQLTVVMLTKERRGEHKCFDRKTYIFK